MKAEILSVGTEILLGDIVNTNAQYISRELALLGINVFHQAVVGDNGERLLKQFQESFERADLVITTGGLGPTTDDITKEIAAKFFSKEIIVDEESYEHIKGYYKQTNRPMTDGSIKQAYILEGSIVLPNNHGSAPGIVAEDEGKILIMLPGPPKEMKPMFDDYVVPYLKKYQDGIMISKVLRTCGVGEGKMENLVKDIVESGVNPTIAPYAKDGEAILRVTAKAETKEEAVRLIEPVEKEIRKRLGENIYGVDDTTLEAEIAKLLLEKKLTISTAESCTGGMVAARLINYPGISEVFMEGAVTYSNDAKIRRLGVKDETLKRYGAVSRETAAEMAKGIAKTSGTNIGVSTTGVAGPGCSERKPAGLVYIGICINGEVKVKELNLWGDRVSVRNNATIGALDFLRRELI